MVMRKSVFYSSIGIHDYFPIYGARVRASRLSGKDGVGVAGAKGLARSSTSFNSCTNQSLVQATKGKRIMRQLKHHEKKLLRKVDLYSYKGEDNLRVAKIMRRYHLQNREDYTAYSRICGMITKLVAKLITLQADDAFRIAMTDQLLTKLMDMGVITTKKSLQKAQEVTASALCRRRLPVIMVRLKMAENMRMAVTWVEQGQVRVGPTVVTDPAFLVTKPMEDYVTWVDQSKIRRSVQQYNDKLDDFDLL
jgi:U3 small nucleolar ribonucleoprotein protein IMP3